MSFRAGAPEKKAGLMARLRSFGRDGRGVAAVEFAFIAPILLAMYFLTMETSQAIETSKKVARLGSMVADLVTQQQSLAKADIDAIMQIGQSTLQPYGRSQPTIIVTGITISTDATPKVQVAWSRKMVNGVTSADAAKNSTTTVPASLIIPGTFLVRVQSQLAYKPVITWSATDKTALGLSAAFDNIDMGDSYYLRPRVSASIPCSDC